MLRTFKKLDWHRLLVDEIIPKIGNFSKNSTLVFFSGAGISAESGVQTFRDQGGLWEKHSIEEVATPEAFERNPEKVLRFYNDRRRQLFQVEPNAAHRAIAEIGQSARVKVITQNVDDLHERAGSPEVLHLHGELKKAQSSANPEYKVDLEGDDINLGDKAPDGSQLRPNVVWFGEMVPNMVPASELVGQADLLVVTGSSLNVYPAAGLLHDVRSGIPIIVIDPAQPELSLFENVYHITQKAAEGVPQLCKVLGAYLSH